MKAVAGKLAGGGLAGVLRSTWFEAQEIAAKHSYGRKSHQLGNLRLSHRVEEAEVLCILNDVIEYPREDPDPQKRPTGESEPKFYLRDLLRNWVDEWIDSGVSTDGTERPALRRFSTTTQPTPASLALWSYSSTLRLIHDADGRIMLWGQPPSLPFRADHGRPLDHLQSATAYFSCLLLSPLAQKIAKCRAEGCGTYFALKQVKRQYYGGALCLVHARARTQKKAKAGEEQAYKEAFGALYEFLATRFGTKIQGKDWQRDKALLGRMAIAASKFIEDDDTLRPLYTTQSHIGITKAWLLRKKNADGIKLAMSLLGKRKKTETQHATR